MLLHMLGCCMGWDIGVVGDGETACDGPGDVGVGDVVVLGAEYVLDPLLPEDIPPPARAKTSSGIKKQRKKNRVKSISPFDTHRFFNNITPPKNSFFPSIAFFIYFECNVSIVGAFCNAPR
jgi:hypothetical protein